MMIKQHGHKVYTCRGQTSSQCIAKYSMNIGILLVWQSSYDNQHVTYGIARLLKFINGVIAFALHFTIAVGKINLKLPPMRLFRLEIFSNILDLWLNQSILNEIECHTDFNSSVLILINVSF